MIKSPCINICSLDPNTNLCLGCGRSVEEISNWINLSKEEKKTLIKLKKNKTFKRNNKKVNNLTNFNSVFK